MNGEQTLLVARFTADTGIDIACIAITTAHMRLSRSLRKDLMELTCLSGTFHPANDDQRLKGSHTRGLGDGLSPSKGTRARASV